MQQNFCEPRHTKNWRLPEIPANKRRGQADPCKMTERPEEAGSLTASIHLWFPCTASWSVVTIAVGDKLYQTEF